MDIEGCYNNMPKEAIRQAMREALEAVLEGRREQGQHTTTISVPLSRKQKCSWGVGTKRGCINVTAKVMLELIEFDLENALLRMPGGVIARQRLGIPMGSPLSPAMAIITTAWMEKRWMASLSQGQRGSFRAMRFMDDIFVRYREGEDVLQRLKADCYLPPLKLEDAEQDTFLETTLVPLPDGGLAHRLKNKNEGSTERQQIWRYHRYDSYCPYLQKFGVLMGTLRKVADMASDREQLEFSGQEKLREFELLGYPRRVLRMACYKMHGIDREREWLTLARDLSTPSHDW